MKKKFLITVMVERTYGKIVEAESKEEAEALAETLNIQDDEDNWDGTEVSDPIVDEVPNDK